MSDGGVRSMIWTSCAHAVRANRRSWGASAAEVREARRLEMRALGDRIGAAEQELAEVEARFDELMLGIRDLPRRYVPIGRGEADDQIVRTEGEPRKFEFTPLPRTGS